MKKIWFACVVLSSLAVSVRAFGQSNASPGNAGVRLEAGIAKEEADGDLKAAITVYQQIADDSSAQRAVRAKALLRLGRCDEKLGQQARQVYEQIVRDYADQPVAAQARTRLAAMKQQDQPAAPATMTVRQVEMPPGGSMNVTDTDGQRAVYRDASGRLYFGDLAGRSKRLIFESEDDYGWMPSRDFSSVLLILPKTVTRPRRIAVIRTDGSAFRELPVDGSLTILQWSWDKRYILALAEDRTKLMAVRVTDGEQRQLATVDHNRIDKAEFSPDGRFVVFNTLLETPSVFSVPLEGGKAELVRENAMLLDWTKDGRFVAITSERNGARALLLQSIENGKPSGDPVFIRYGSFDEGYVTANGDLVYSTTPAEGVISARLATLDEGGHPGPWQRLDLRAGNAENPVPIWSPDSERLVYTSRNDAAGQMQSTLILRELASGKEREIYKSNVLFLTCAWPTESDHILCGEATPQKTDLLSIRVDSGQSERIASLPGMHFVLQANRDGSALYIGDVQPMAIQRWDIATGTARILEKGVRFVLPSDDGKWLARRNDNGSDIEIRSTSGATWKTVASGVSRSPHEAFTPDSRWVFYTVDESGRRSLYRVPVNGGGPERLSDYPSEGNGGTMSISPDGRKILSLLYQRNRDLSILENFVPRMPKMPVTAVR